MGIENGDKISDLNPLWPLGTDPVSQGDDQLRLIKNVIVNDALGKSEGGTISADLTVDGDLTVDNITADTVTVNNDLTVISSGFGGSFDSVLTAKQSRPSKSLEQNLITSATDSIGTFSGFQFEVSKGDATADTNLIASINRNGLQVDSISSMGGGHVDGAGKVVQMLFHEWNDEALYNSSAAWGSVTDSSITITPKFSGSKLFVECNTILRCQASGYQAGAAIQIIESSGSALQPEINAFETYISVTGGSTAVDYRVRHVKMNECQTSVVSGTAKTFLFQVKALSSAVDVTVNSNDFYSTMTVWEIAQ